MKIGELKTGFGLNLVGKNNMEKVFMQHNKKYYPNAITEEMEGGRNSVSFLKVLAWSVGITLVVLGIWALNEFLFLRDLKLFSVY